MLKQELLYGHFRSVQPQRALYTKYILVADIQGHMKIDRFTSPTMLSLYKMLIILNFPMILTSGRLVEYEGGGETRSNPWLAELQQDMFAEINPRDAILVIRDGDMVWVRTPEGASIKVMSMITERVAAGVVAVPFTLWTLPR